MTVSVQQFKRRFTEFEEVSESIVQECIDEATLRVGNIAFGNMSDYAIKYLAADAVATSPKGEQSRLKVENRITTYRMKFDQLVREHACGYRVI